MLRSLAPFPQSLPGGGSFKVQECYCAVCVLDAFLDASVEAQSWRGKVGSSSSLCKEKGEPGLPVRCQGRDEVS